MDSTEPVNLGNWRRSPWNRWAFRNVAEMLPVAKIPAQLGRQTEIPLGEPLGDRLPDGSSLDATLRETETDGFLILRDGKLIAEWYGNDLDAATPHIVFSVSKSITAILAGVLVGQKRLDPDAPVTRYVPEVAGTAYGDCSVRHVLDMTVNIDFVEDYLDPHGPFARYRAAMGWNPVADPAATPSLHPFLTTLPHGKGAHGERFHYVSPNSDLLGWIVERAGGQRYAALLSELIWRPLGAGQDGYVTIDKGGAARAAGGICVTLRDLALFGEMIRNGGRIGTTEIVPADWIEDIRTAGDREAWKKGDLYALLPEGGYRSQWYQTGNAHGAFTAIGIHGQWLYIDPAARLVIAKLSSQALPVDDPLDQRLLKLFGEIGQALA
jgi:CubicO group peptidase (beta-lactamase class C family)